jgi:endonuclease/exonuclease/phosphatase family metal-dependent hydrolase
MIHKFLRFLTLNLWGDNGPWASRLALVADKLDNLLPDVVALQEVREAPGRVVNQAHALAHHRGYTYVYGATTRNVVGGGDEGLAILSRAPIGAQQLRMLPHSTETEGRGVLSARIDSPDFGSFWVHATHLSYRQHEGDKREEQVQAVHDAVTAHDGDSPQIIMGDFNAVPHADEIRWLCGLTTLGGRRVFYQDAWDILHAGQPGYTWARTNPYIERLGFLRPDRRIDYIFVTPPRRDGRGAIHSARLIFDEPMVMPSGERLFASDHFGVVAEVQMVGNPAPGVAG